jgi:hypothetical protein
MANIYVFTVGNPVAKAHVDDSFISGVASSLLVDQFPWTLLDEIQRLAGGLYAWGSLEGKRNVANWNKLQQGDFVICAENGRYHYIARVVHKEHNQPAAQSIWGSDKSGKAPEYMYFLTKPVPVNPPSRFEALGDYLNAGYVGFTRIGDAKNRAIVVNYDSLDNFFEARLGFDSSQHTFVAFQSEIALNKAEAEGKFEPSSPMTASQNTLEAIIRRRGQKEFRHSLLAAYSGRCAITGCDVPELLEAAYILGYKGRQTNHISNGLLLRSDIHTLFDLRLITVDGSTFTVKVHPSLRGGEYGELSGKKISLPEYASLRPNAVALAMHGAR